MNRDFAALDRPESFDLLVIGGGIYGAWVAYDAAIRGLQVALVERTDWGAGTSSSSSKLIHGGLRYLESYRFGLVRKSLLERHRLMRLAPHQVQPMRFVIPMYRGDRVGRWRLALGLAIYDRLAGGARGMAAHRRVGREELLRGAGFLEKQDLLSGFDYGDSVMDDARLVVEVVDGAVASGAAAVNHATVERLLLRGDEADGAVVRDGESGSSLEVRARATVSCAGPWAAGLLPRSDGNRSLVRFQKGVHLVMPSLGLEQAMLVMARADGRPYFLIPWYGRTLLGTTDTLYEGDPDALRVEPDDVRYLLGDAARVLGDRRWTEDDVLGSYVGLRTLQNRQAASPGRISREWRLLTPHPRLLMPVGGKYTAARADAERIVDRVLKMLGRDPVAGTTAVRPLPWCPAVEFGAWWQSKVDEGVARGLDPDCAAWAARRFGTRVAEIHRLVQEEASLAARLDPKLPFCRAELVMAVRHEMARTLEDVLRRRLPLLLLGPPGPAWLEEAAATIGDELGWPESRRREEVRAVLARFGPGAAP